MAAPYLPTREVVIVVFTAALPYGDDCRDQPSGRQRIRSGARRGIVLVIGTAFMTSAGVLAPLANSRAR
jgi:hypothetical protein